MHTIGVAHARLQQTPATKSMAVLTLVERAVGYRLFRVGTVPIT